MRPWRRVHWAIVVIRPGCSTGFVHTPAHRHVSEPDSGMSDRNFRCLPVVL